MTKEQHYAAIRSARDRLKSAWEHCCQVFAAAEKAGLTAKITRLSLNLPPDLDPCPAPRLKRD